MPNHVTTILEAPQHVIDSLGSSTKYVDFNSVIPMPSEDDPIFTATRVDYGFASGYQNDGFSPLGWAVNNWGTKWNAYDIERLSPASVKFNTAWSHPEPVILALSKKFPDEIIQVTYADEDLGHNLGEYLIKNGESTPVQVFVAGSDEALDFAANIKYGMSYKELRAEWDEED